MIGNQISHYTLSRKLGAGTYGEVYEGVHAHDPELKVAVKIVARALVDDARFVEALKKECRQLDRMDHPNIVRFRELVVTDAGVAMVLELLDGQDLHARLAGGPLPVDTAVAVVEAVLEGLAYAHARGVMHRDIKPSNAYWCDDGRIKLLDFGIARAADGTAATKTGHMVGTLDYMAPERFDDRGGSMASDVYAVGLIAWELLAGRAACPDGEFGRKLAWHLAQGVGDAARVRSALPACPPWFAEVIATLAAKAPEERPADGAAALALLRAKRPAEGGTEGARRAPPPATVMGPAPVGTAPPVGASVPPRSVPPVSPSGTTGRSAPPGTVATGAGGPAPHMLPGGRHTTAPYSANMGAAAPSGGGPDRSTATSGQQDSTNVPRASAPRYWLWALGTIVLSVLAMAVWSINREQSIRRQLSTQRSEVQFIVEGMRQAEMTHEAAYDSYVAIRDLSMLYGSATSASVWPSDYTEKLGYTPDSLLVWGHYWVEVSADGRNFYVHGVIDADGDGCIHHVVGTQTETSVVEGADCY